MTNRLLLILCSLFVLSSCSSEDKVKELVTQDLTPDLSITEFSDSSFFSDIRQMQFYDGNVILSDYQRAQIFTLDKDFNLLKSFGTVGEGPGEFMDLTAFYIYNDQIAVYDGAKNFYNILNIDGDYLYGIYKPKGVYLRTRKMSFNEKTITDCAIRKESMGLVTFDVKDTSKKVFFGEDYKFTNKNQYNIRNGRYIYQNDKYIIAVSDNMPFIEKYDNKGQLIEKYDLSSIDLIQKQLEYISNKKHNSDLAYTILTKEAYLNKDKLYIMVNTNTQDNYYANTVIEFDVKKDITPLRIFKLPSTVYWSMCANDDYLFTFNRSLCALERYKLLVSL